MLEKLLAEPVPTANSLPDRFVNLMRVLMDKRDAQEGDVGRVAALATLNQPLGREGFEAFFGEDEQLYVRHVATRTLSAQPNPHRPFTPAETKKRDQLSAYLDGCLEDELIEEVLLPLLRQLGFHRITSAGHKDKNLEHGKDVWMRFTLPSQHMLYFGIQAKKGKLDASADSRNREGANTNVAVIHNQVLMMLDSEVFDPRAEPPRAGRSCLYRCRRRDHQVGAAMAGPQPRRDQAQPNHVHGPRRHPQPVCRKQHPASRGGADKCRSSPVVG